MNEIEKSENIRIKYQAALGLKVSESQIQWDRYNVILIVNTVLLGLIGLNYSGDYKELPTLFKNLLVYLPLIGIFICILWFLMTWRGFKWSHFWIAEANTLEKDLVGGINPIREGALKQGKLLKTEYAAYAIIVVFLLMYVYILPLGGFKFPMTSYLNLSAVQVSQIFYNIAVGLGALLAGMGGLKILYSWAQSGKEDQRRKKLREELKTKYPPRLHLKTYRLIESTVNPDWVYLYDFKSGKKHHIASMLTLLRLGYMRNWAKKTTPHKFNLIDEGDEFLTDGERYS